MESCFHALTRLTIEALLGRISEGQSFDQARLVGGCELLFDVSRVDILHTLVIGDIMSICSFRFPRAAALLVREVLA